VSRDMTDMKIAVVPGGVSILIGGALEGARAPYGEGGGPLLGIGWGLGDLGGDSLLSEDAGGLELFLDDVASASACRPACSHACSAELRRVASISLSRRALLATLYAMILIFVI